jgi:uncharacterized membrane protein
VVFIKLGGSGNGSRAFGNKVESREIYNIVGGRYGEVAVMLHVCFEISVIFIVVCSIAALGEANATILHEHTHSKL